MTDYAEVAPSMEIPDEEIEEGMADFHFYPKCRKLSCKLAGIYNLFERHGRYVAAYCARHAREERDLCAGSLSRRRPSYRGESIDVYDRWGR